MTDRQKITLIYSVVALVGLLILGTSFLLVKLKPRGAEEAPEGVIAVEVGKESLKVLMTLDEDLALVKQDGTEVKISDLQDKVWVAAQYYTSCPMCAARNGEQLLDIYKKFEDRDDFMVVCFSIDPEGDTFEHMMAMEENLEVDGDKWWFVKGDPEKLKRYMVEKMGYPEVLERVDQAEIEAKGRWAHDLGIEVFHGMDLIIKANLEESEYNDVRMQRALLDAAVEEGFKKKAEAALSAQ